MWPLKSLLFAEATVLPQPPATVALQRRPIENEMFSAWRVWYGLCFVECCCVAAVGVVTMPVMLYATNVAIDLTCRNSGEVAL